MFKLLGCLIILCFIPVLFLGGLALRLWYFIIGKPFFDNNQQTGRSNRQSTNSHNSTNSRNSTNSKPYPNNPNGKIFKDNEGDYVDFIEVD